VSRCRRSCITEMNRKPFVLFGMNNRMSGPYSAAKHRAFIQLMILVGAGARGVEGIGYRV
jgi:hypothetical protein